MIPPHHPIVDTSAGVELLMPGQLSPKEEVRGLALKIANGTVTDPELIEAYLRERAPQSKATRATYAAHLRRLEWFCTRHMMLSGIRALQREDWPTLAEYLRRPPLEDCMSVSVGVKHPAWRPFRLPSGLAKAAQMMPASRKPAPSDVLTPASVAQAMSVMRNFMGWMADPAVGALRSNPFATVKPQRVRVSESAKEVSRFLSVEAVGFVRGVLDAMPRSRLLERRTHARAAWLVYLALFSGLRAHELAKAHSDMIGAGGAGSKTLNIVRKGELASKVPLAPAALRYWRQYLDAVGFSEKTAAPLIGKVDGKPESVAAFNPLTRQMIWHILKQIFAAAARRAHDAGDADSEASLGAASTHWLRHSFAVNLVDSDVSLVTVRDLLDHSSLTTTSKYLHRDDDSRRADLARMVNDVERRLDSTPSPKVPRAPSNS